MAVQRRLAAILAADVAGYARLIGADEEGTRARVGDCLEAVIGPAIAEHGGRLVKTMGDGFLVEHGSVLGAVQAAVDIQAAMARLNQGEPDDRRMDLRIGIHLGDVIIEGEDIHGEGVNIAARIEALAEPGGICVSDMVHAGVRNKLAIAFGDMGEQSLKNIADPVRLFRAILAEEVTGAAPSPSEAMFRRPAVAVLPFQNLSGDPDQEYFADGLTEDIITALSLWRSFPVIARNSTFAYKGTSPDIRKVGDELGARYVIEGSVRRGGKRVRVTAQLINAENGHHVWAERYDRDLEDIFELQDEITERIAGVIAPELSMAELQRSSAKHPNSLNAWECYLRGLATVYEGTKEGNIRARAFFEQAIEIDSDYGKAYMGLSYLHARDARLDFTATPGESIRMALECARRAVALDNSDSDAYTTLARALVMDGQHEDSVTAVRKGIDINPFDAEARLLLGGVLSTSGSPREGFSSLQEGLALNPRIAREYIWQTFMALACICMDDHERGVNLARQALAQRPDYTEARAIAGAGPGFLGRSNEASEFLVDDGGTDFGHFVSSRPNWDASTKEKMLEGLRKAGWES